MQLTTKQLNILKHSLGLDNTDKAYRNRFIASEGHADWEDLMLLCDLGYMKRNNNPGWLVGDVFYVTDKGKDLLNVDYD